MKKVFVTIAILLISIHVSCQTETIVENDYNYYKGKFDNGTLARNIGIGLVATGVALFGVGVSMWFWNVDESNAFIYTYVAMFVNSFTAIFAGISFSIAGSMKRSKNKKIMERMEPNVKLSFGVTKYGPGLRLRF